MKKVLWIGDAVVSTGFAKCTHKILEGLYEKWEIHVLGLNYPGDPHPYPYKIYPSWPGGDMFGIKRIEHLLKQIEPDIVVVQNDPWNIPAYVNRIRSVKVSNEPKIIAIMPVDGLNVKNGAELNAVDHAIWWTSMAQREGSIGGYTGPSTVIPLGVDLGLYRPGDKLEARREFGFSDKIMRGFIIGNTNRNQPRKRLDLTIAYFAQWVKDYKIDDAYLYLHVAPTGDLGYDCQQLIHYFGIKGRMLLATPEIGFGLTEEMLVKTYQLFDLQVSTTQGEGWGLTTAEGMACGIPQLVPDWSALGDWARGAVELVGCSEIAVTPNHINVVGGVPDRGDFINKLDRIYRDADHRDDLIRRGLERVTEPMFRWDVISNEYDRVLTEVAA